MGTTHFCRAHFAYITSILHQSQKSVHLMKQCNFVRKWDVKLHNNIIILYRLSLLFIITVTDMHFQVKAFEGMINLLQICY